jgi:hypothetical protein
MVSQAEVRVAAPADSVWAALSDFGAVTRWDPAAIDSQRVSELGQGVGAERRVQHARRGALLEKATAWEDGRRMVVEAAPEKRGVFLRWSRTREWTLAADGDGTKVAVTSTLQLKPPWGPVGALAWLYARASYPGQDQREAKAAADGLKAYVEGGGSGA